MLDLNSPEFTRPAPSGPREGPTVQAFALRHRAFLILVGVLIAQLLLLSFQITRNQNVRLIQVWAVTVFDPFERSLRGVVTATARAWRSYRGLWQAQSENQELHAHLVAANARIRQLSDQAAEAERLRALLDFKSRLPFQTVAAEVLATSPGEYSDAIFIDKGGKSGLTSNLAVVTPEGIVGKVVAAFPHTAQVLLITDLSSGVGVMLERSRVQGILKGAGRNLCQVHYVMNEEPVSPGEAVVTSGFDQIYPKGLLVGTVLQTGEGNIYKRIVVKPAAALSRLEAVLVVLKPTSGQHQAMNFPAQP